MNLPKTQVRTLSDTFFSESCGISLSCANYGWFLLERRTACAVLDLVRKASADVTSVTFITNFWWLSAAPKTLCSLLDFVKARARRPEHQSVLTARCIDSAKQFDTPFWAWAEQRKVGLHLWLGALSWEIFDVGRKMASWDTSDDRFFGWGFLASSSGVPLSPKNGEPMTPNRVSPNWVVTISTK